MKYIKILDSDSLNSNRIGGCIPDIHAGLQFEYDVQYFGTFITNPNLDEISVYHRFDTNGIDPSRDIIDFNNRIIENGRMIWAMAHGESSRSSRSLGNCEGRAIGEDAVHKVWNMGDGEYVNIPWNKVLIETLRVNGYKHLVSIGTLGGNLVDGFPWDPGCIHIWAMNFMLPESYRYIIEQ